MSETLEQWLEHEIRHAAIVMDAVRAEAHAIRERFDACWLAAANGYLSRLVPAGTARGKTLDIAVILGAVHGDHDDESHSARDPRMHATLLKLERLFGGLYAINHNRPNGRGVAMGRYEGDAYYAGGAYFFATLGAAAFCMLVASAASEGIP